MKSKRYKMLCWREIMNTRYSSNGEGSTIYRVYGEDGTQYIVCVEKTNKEKTTI